MLGAGLYYILLSFAHTLALLFVGRVISGVTSASLTAANAYIADVSPPEKRAQNFCVAWRHQTTNESNQQEKVTTGLLYRHRLIVRLQRLEKRD
jgi:hypothetical protein